mgnify:CR=1 FL=1
MGNMARMSYVIEFGLTENPNAYQMFKNIVEFLKSKHATNNPAELITFIKKEFDIELTWVKAHEYSATFKDEKHFIFSSLRWS